MARQSKGARLWLRPPSISKDGATANARWIIKDSGKQIGTGCGIDQRLEAEVKLQDYLQQKVGKQYKEPEHACYIYFVSAKVFYFPIKIGITKDKFLRFKQLQISLPFDLEVLAMVPIRFQSVERKIHRKFKHLHMRGEWFKRDPELLAFIDALNIDAESGFGAFDRNDAFADEDDGVLADC